MRSTLLGAALGVAALGLPASADCLDCGTSVVAPGYALITVNGAGGGGTYGGQCVYWSLGDGTARFAALTHATPPPGVAATVRTHCELRSGLSTVATSSAWAGGSGAVFDGYGIASAPNGVHPTMVCVRVDASFGAASFHEERCAGRGGTAAVAGTTTHVPLGP